MGINMAPDRMIFALRLLTVEPMISAIQAAQCLCFFPTMGTITITQST
jgi:hypothetical protein